MHSIIALDTTQSAASSPASPAEESVVRDPTDAFDGSSLSDEPTDDFDESFYSDEAAVTTPTCTLPYLHKTHHSDTYFI